MLKTNKKEVITFTTITRPNVCIKPIRIEPYTGCWYFDDTCDDDKLPERYIINDGATILFWKNGKKTIIKRSKNDNFDRRLAFLTAYFQHHCGLSKNKANKYIDNLIVEEKK